MCIRDSAYSEHLSACADDGQLYDLMPLPFSDESVRRVAERVRVVQDVLERPLIVENVSAYARLPGELEEVDFVRAVLEEADCQLLLDVNNVYVNACNFGFDAHAYIAAMPSRRIAYLHMAGHDEQGASLKIDTHGAPVCDPVWELLADVYKRQGTSSPGRRCRRTPGRRGGSRRHRRYCRCSCSSRRSGRSRPAGGRRA